MKQARAKIILKKNKRIGGVVRHKGAVLMEGYLEEGVSWAHLSKAIQLKEAEAISGDGPRSAAPNADKAPPAAPKADKPPANPPVDPPAKLRVHQAAKEANITSKQLIADAKKVGIVLKSASSGITLDQFHKIYPEGK